MPSCPYAIVSKGLCSRVLAAEAGKVQQSSHKNSHGKTSNKQPMAVKMRDLHLVQLPELDFIYLDPGCLSLLRVLSYMFLGSVVRKCRTSRVQAGSELAEGPT